MNKLLISQIISRQKFDLSTYIKIKNNIDITPEHAKHHLAVLQHFAKKELQIAMSFHYMDNKNNDFTQFVKDCNKHLFKVYAETSKLD